MVEIDQATPVAVRERLNFHSTQMDPIVSSLKKETVFLESFFMCTCNRSFLLFTCQTRVLDDAKLTALKLFNTWATTSIPLKYIRLYSGREALKHILRIALGMESAIFGEDQILGQLRIFYRAALVHHLTGNLLNKIIQRTQSVARKIKKDIPLAHGRTSLSGLAIKAVQDFKKVKGKNDLKVLIVGWGSVTYAIYKGLSGITDSSFIKVANRTQENIKIDCQKIGFDEVKNTWSLFDVVVSMTSRTGYVIEVKQTPIEHEILLLDLGVPRNVDPLLVDVPHITLFNIDDLNNRAHVNLEERRRVSRELPSMATQFETEMLALIEKDGEDQAINAKMRSVMTIFRNALLLSNPSLEVEDRRKLISSASKKIYGIMHAGENAPVV